MPLDRAVPGWGPGHGADVSACGSAGTLQKI